MVILRTFYVFSKVSKCEADRWMKDAQFLFCWKLKKCKIKQVQGSTHLFKRTKIKMIKANIGRVMKRQSCPYIASDPIG